MIVTSFGVNGYEQYGKRFIDTFLEFCPDENLVVYIEEPVDFRHERVEFRELLEIPGMIETFEQMMDVDEIYKGIDRLNGQKMYDYRYDAFRFCRKVFAIVDVSKNVKTGKFAWLDADILFHSPMSENFLDEVIPDDTYISYLARPWSHCETGFIGFNCNFADHQSFMASYKGIYQTGAFRYLGQWHDCYMLDFLISMTGVPVTNLAEDLTMDHVFINTVLGKYMDHLKGPERKKAGRSPQHEAITNHTETEHWEAKKSVKKLLKMP